MPDFDQFEIVLRNEWGKAIAGIWFRRGGWRISTDHQLVFQTKDEALLAWEQLFDHYTGMRIVRPRIPWMRPWPDRK